MSIDSIEFSSLVLVVSLAAALFLYSAYWAFSIRKVLVTFIYRRQALWVGVVGLFFTLFFLFAALSISLKSNNTIYNVIISDAFVVAAFIVIFGWIDSSMSVGRRTDPLHRNTLHWKGLRYFIIIATSFGIFFNVILNLPFGQTDLSNSIVQGFPLLAPIGTALVFGGIALLVSARRSKDVILKRHLKWFGGFVMFLYFTSTIEQEVFSKHQLIQNPLIFGMITYALFALAAYFLYHSAKVLVPLSPYPSTSQEEDISVVPQGET